MDAARIAQALIDIVVDSTVPQFATGIDAVEEHPTVGEDGTATWKMTSYKDEGELKEDGRSVESITYVVTVVAVKRYFD